MNLNADPELLAGFFDETRDMLATVGDLLVQLERAPGDRQIIEAIFRPVHSIKGNAAFFGFLRGKSLAHRLENLLDALRKGRLAVDQGVITILLSGVDALHGVFERLRSGGPEIADEAALAALIESIAAQEARAGAAAGGAPDWNRVRHDLTLAEAAMAGLGEGPQAAVASLIRHLRALAPGAGKTHDGPPLPVGGPLAALARLLDPPLEGQLAAAAAAEVLAGLEQLAALAADEAARSLVAEMIDGYRTFTEAMGFEGLLRDFLRERLARAAGMPGFASTAPVPAAEAVPVEAAGSAAARPAQPQGKSMRVSEDRIDTFLHYVGELLVIGDMFDHLQGRLRGADPITLQRDFRRANETFASLSNKLQQAIMTIRKVPLRALLQKVPRIIRDTAVVKGKDVLVEVVGEEVEADKSLLDLLDAPITHMSRNAVDHGIETPERRLAAGKPGQGRVTVSAVETSQSIVLTISDDGAGLNLERIRAKAEQLGIIAPGAVLGEQDVVACIFAPGLSTADQITDISGRGVGMDVVKRSIEDAGGTIQISTSPGQGSSFVLTLPKRVTTQILPGYLVRLAGHLYVLPLDRVRETFRLREDEITSVAGRGRCLVRHGEVVPLVTLADVLALWRPEPPKRATVVTVECRRRRLAVVVDEVIGVQKVVIRRIQGLPAETPLIAGGTLMGDGSVALILDPDHLRGD